MSDIPSDPPSPQLNEFEQSFMDAIQARWPVNEPTGQGSAADSEPPGTPESESVAAPGGEGQPDEGQVGSESPETVGQPAEGEATGGGDGQPSPVFTLSGHDYSPDQLAQAVQVHDWFARLEPGQVQAIDALLSGHYRLAPMQEAAPQPQVQPAVSPGQTPSLSQQPGHDDEGEWLDPRAAQEIADLRNQIQQLSQNVNANLGPVVQHQLQSDFQSRLDQISSASDAFRDRYQLDDNQMQTLEAAIVESQVLPSLASRFGSISNGMQAALEMFFWTTPDYRDPYLKAQSTALDAEQAQTEADTVRKQQLTALSASGGSAPRREPVPSNHADREQAMRAEIAAAMNGSGAI